VTIKQDIEKRVEENLKEMKGKSSIPKVEVPDKFGPCHWCSGMMRETPTKGRLECTTCGSVSLCGRQTKVVHVGTGR
jgi:hypothetical protein